MIIDLLAEACKTLFCLGCQKLFEFFIFLSNSFKVFTQRLLPTWPTSTQNEASIAWSLLLFLVPSSIQFHLFLLLVLSLVLQVIWVQTLDIAWFGICFWLLFGFKRLVSVLSICQKATFQCSFLTLSNSIWSCWVLSCLLETAKSVWELPCLFGNYRSLLLKALDRRLPQMKSCLAH